MNLNYLNVYDKYKAQLESLNKKKSAQAGTNKLKTLSLYNTLLANMNANKQAQDLSNLANTQNLNTKAQSFLAQQQALKYTPQHLDRLGLGRTGLNETTNANIRNVYLNAIANQDIATQNLQSNIFNQYLQSINQNEQNLENFNMQHELEQDALRQQEQNQYLDYYLNKLGTAPTLKDFDRYLEYAKQYLNKENYGTLTKDLELQDYRKALLEHENLLKNEELLSQYGISSNDGIRVEDITVKSFGNFVGTDKGKKQDQHIQRIKSFALAGHFRNGDIIDVNLGGGTNNYMYFIGRFYKTTKKANRKFVWYDDKNAGYLTRIK